MFKLALTGGIATGKSYVLGKLRERGVPGIDADELVHAAFAPGTPTTALVAKEFGSDVLRPEGGVDRARLGARVFDDPDARLRLESIVHPLVYAEIERWFATLAAPLGVASIPLLFETGHQDDFDAIVVTACKPEQQLERLIARGLSDEDAHKRMAAQLATEDKAPRADFVIWTSGSMSDTDAQIGQLLDKLTGQ